MSSQGVLCVVASLSLALFLSCQQSPEPPDAQEPTDVAETAPAPNVSTAPGTAGPEKVVKGTGFSFKIPGSWTIVSQGDRVGVSLP